MRSKLLVVFPVCAGDISAAKDIATWINEVATFEEEYGCLIAADYNTPAGDIEELAALHAGSFTDVRAVQLYDAPPRLLWPAPQNHMFKRVAQEVAWQHAKDYDSFFFCEPDVTPLCENWLPTFETAYRAAKTPFFGHIGPTRILPPGVSVTSHMNGAAIYPADVMKYSPRFVLANTTPWDIWASEDVLSLCGDARGLIVKQFRTQEFQLCANNAIACRQFYRRRNGEMVDLSLVESFLAYAVLHHGCKDGSLLKLVRSLSEKQQAFSDKIPAEPVEVLEVVQEKVEPPAASTVHEEPVVIAPREPSENVPIIVSSLKGKPRHRRMKKNHYYAPTP